MVKKAHNLADRDGQLLACNPRWEACEGTHSHCSRALRGGTAIHRGGFYGCHKRLEEGSKKLPGASLVHHLARLSSCYALGGVSGGILRDSGLHRLPEQWLRSSRSLPRDAGQQRAYVHIWEKVDAAQLLPAHEKGSRSTHVVRGTDRVSSITRGLLLVGVVLQAITPKGASC
jgi:hypothetical protein